MNAKAAESAKAAVLCVLCGLRVLRWASVLVASDPAHRDGSFNRPSRPCHMRCRTSRDARSAATPAGVTVYARRGRSEEHTSELQSRPHLVCRLLLDNTQ